MGAEPCGIKDRAKNKIEREMGPVIIGALSDPRTVEVMVNPDGKVWQEKLGENMMCIEKLRPAQVQAVIETVAGYHGKEVTRKNPIIEGELPFDGSRFAGQLPPVVQSPTFTIRKKALLVYTLENYVARGVMSPRQKDEIARAVADHRNILVVGGTGSGKTTLVNAIINQMVIEDPSERIVIIEDTGEIQCRAENYVQFHTSPEISMTALLKTTLRIRPDRILVGEVRGPEALDLLMAWNTGHEGGAATLHANNARAGLDRLSMLISMNQDSPRPIEPLIAAAVHQIVHIKNTNNGRRVQEVVGISGYKNSKYIIEKGNEHA